MPEPHPTPLFNCPNCNALYHVVKADLRSEIVDRWVTCRTCNGPLPAREGKFVLKYLLQSGPPQYAGTAKFPTAKAAVAFLTYRDGVDAFRFTDRLSEDEKATLMGATLSEVYNWKPARVPRGKRSGWCR
jgi:predicted Zn finger-like uncharacterized protein